MKTKIAIISIIFAVFTVIAACGTAQVQQEANQGTPELTAINSPGTATPVPPTATVTVNLTPKPTATIKATPIIFIKAPKIREKAMDYYPIHVGNLLYFKGVKRDALDKQLKVKAEVVGMEKKGGKEYYYFYAPQVNIRYLMRSDDNGIYMGVIKYPFPLFGFSIEVDLNPEMVIMKSPIKPGERWTHKGRAEATIFGFIKVGRDIRSDFECVRKEMIRTETGKIEAYHIKVIVDDGAKNITEEKYWYAKGVGYANSDTSGHIANLVGYKIFDEKTGTWNEKIPEGVEGYE